MAILEKQNKLREDNDPEFKQKLLASFQSFFARAVRTSENPLTYPDTPACSAQIVSAAPNVIMLPIPLTPSLRAASLPSALAATTLLKPFTFLLGPAFVPAAANEIMEDSLVVILFISPHSGGSSHLHQHNSPAKPFSLEDGFTAGYPPVPKTRAGRMDDEIYFNHATQRPMCWKECARDFFCVCDLNSSVPCNGTQIKRCLNLNLRLKALNLSSVSNSITTHRVSQF